MKLTVQVSTAPVRFRSMRGSGGQGDRQQLHHRRESLMVEAEPNGKVDLCDSSGTVDLLVDIGCGYTN